LRVLSGPGGLEPRLHADEQSVVRTVVRPLELEDVTLLGVGAGEADGMMRRLQAGGAEPDLVHSVSATDPLGHLGRAFPLVPVHTTVLELTGQGLDQLRVRVPALERAESHVEIEVFVPVRVPEVDPFRAAHEEGVRVEEPVVGVDPERAPLASSLPDLSGTGGPAFVFGKRRLKSWVHVLTPSGFPTRVRAVRPTKTLPAGTPFGNCRTRMATVKTGFGTIVSVTQRSR